MHAFSSQEICNGLVLNLPSLQLHDSEVLRALLVDLVLRQLHRADLSLWKGPVYRNIPPEAPKAGKGEEDANVNLRGEGGAASACSSRA